MHTLTDKKEITLTPHNKIMNRTFLITRGVDPKNTLNLDPDPEYWPIFDPDPGICYQF